MTVTINTPIKVAGSPSSVTPPSVTPPEEPEEKKFNWTPVFIAAGAAVAVAGIIVATGKKEKKVK